MNYEQRYKEALKAVKELQEANPSDDGIQNWVEEKFPELHESWDERIRKEILEYFQQFENEGLRGINISDWIAWLEKQKSEEINVKALLTADRLAAAEMTGRLKERKDIVENPQKYGLKKQCRQKPAEWSEEDENMVRYIGNAITCKESAKYLEEKGVDMIKAHRWLESSRHQKQWKPNEKQIKALRWVLQNIPYCTHKEEIYELLEQLKKLKGE